MAEADSPIEGIGVAILETHPLPTSQLITLQNATIANASTIVSLAISRPIADSNELRPAPRRVSRGEPRAEGIDREMDGISRA